MEEASVILERHEQRINTLERDISDLKAVQTEMDSLRKSRAPSFCFSTETSVPVFQPSRMRISNGMVTLPLVVTNLYVFIFGFLLSVFFDLDYIVRSRPWLGKSPPIKAARVRVSPIKFG